MYNLFASCFASSSYKRCRNKMAQLASLKHTTWNTGVGRWVFLLGWPSFRGKLFLEINYLSLNWFVWKRWISGCHQQYRHESMKEPTNFPYRFPHQQYVDVSENSGNPKSSNFNRVFHYKPSILGYPYFWKHPCIDSFWYQSTCDLFFGPPGIVLQLSTSGTWSG